MWKIRRISKCEYYQHFCYYIMDWATRKKISSHLHISIFPIFRFIGTGASQIASGRQIRPGWVDATENQRHTCHPCWWVDADFRFEVKSIDLQCFWHTISIAGFVKLIKGAQTGAWKNTTVREGWLNALVTVEVLCWFYVGECIGKRHYVGYNI